MPVTKTAAVQRGDKERKWTQDQNKDRKKNDIKNSAPLNSFPVDEWAESTDNNRTNTVTVNSTVSWLKSKVSLLLTVVPLFPSLLILIFAHAYVSLSFSLPCPPPSYLSFT